MNIPLIRPFITENLKRKVCDVLDSGYLTEGPVTREFEESIGQFIGAKHVLAVTSCTTGLELGLRAMGIGPGDEVIVPDYTYPATASVVNIVGADSVIVDADPDTMLIDYDALENAITPRTKAVIPVSLFGNPLDWDRLNALKEKYDLFMLEDAACSLGAAYKGSMVGSLADISVFSHHPRKFITTGEGGTVATNNRQWAEWMQSYKHFGMGIADSRLTAEFVQPGTNYKLSNVLAAIGLAQMEVVDELLAERRQLAERYKDMLGEISDLALPRTTDGGEHSWQTFCVFVDNRDTIMTAMREKGIEAQIGTYSLHMHSAFSDNPHCKVVSDMQGSRFAFAHALALPLYHGMTDDEQVEIVKTLKGLVG